MTNWKEYKFSDFVEINPKVALKKGIEYSFVEMKDLSDENKFVTPSQKRPLTGGSRFENNDTLFARITPCLENGKIAQVKELENGVGFGSTEFLIFRGKKGVSNTDFVHYLSLSDEVRSFAEQNMVGTSGRQRVSWQAFENLTLILPDLPTQIAISEILSSLDDKIELNNKINSSLENLAQTLFKQWFIDFEFPNENGEPYKASGGEMVDSVLGEIPKGWEVGNLNQIAELQKKNKKPFENPDRIYHHYSLPEFDSGKMPSMELGEKILSSKYQVLEHSILVSKLNPRIPRIWPIIKPNDNSICSTEFQVLKPLEDIFFPFVNCLCSSDGYINSIQSKVTGTSSSHQRVNPKDIINYEVVLPPLSIVNQFYYSVYDSLNLVDNNRKENQELTTLRDTLLPKLISGELEVNEEIYKIENYNA
jgi:type I restriction enzyme S subunit